MLNFNSKIMKEDMMKVHGIMPNKSSSIIFPLVPEEYLNHFVRFINYRKYFVSFVGGSKPFMMSLKKKIETAGFETNFTEHQTFFCVYVSGGRTLKLFSDWMYKDKDLFLKRKYNEFKLEKLPLEQLQDRGIKVHKNALKLREIELIDSGD